MAKKEFKSESKRLLNLMINSIYTHKEIFLRELISNASDALDKYYYLSLQDENIVFDKENFYIRITTDKDNRIIKIADKGIGMSKEELEENLGTIAKSGSFAFKNENEKADGVDIIGQFGVGFYSAFMVGSRIVVKSKKYGENEGYMWESDGADGYEISSCGIDEVGTEITIYLKENTEDENYDEYLDEWTIRSLIKKYSDYIKYPIKMMVTKSRPKAADENADKDAKPEYEEYSEDEVLNSMVPIWRKNKSEVSDEEYNNFYKEKFFDFEDPSKIIYMSADGLVSYKSLMFIPKRPPYNYYTKDFKKGLQLYANGVLIMENCEDLLPDYFGFVKGLVDSSDLSLNISREILQHDRQLKAIGTSIKKKIKSELENMLKNDREKYVEFYENFKRPLKFGMYENYGMNKEFLVDLIMFYSSSEKKLVTLKEYVERMKEGQEFIYYASGETTAQVDRLPQTEILKDKGYEILYFTEDVDEFAVKVLGKYMDKAFKSVSDSGLDIAGEEEKKAEEEAAKTNKELFDFLKETLGEKVASVKPSTRLKSFPVCVTSEGDVSLEMEKVLNAMPSDNNIKAQRVLEININHEIFEKLKSLYGADNDKLKKYANVLYNCAMLTEGMSIENPTEFAADTCSLLG